MIKKWKIAFITTILTFCISCCIVNANGIEVKSNEGLLPLRQVAESVGYTVEWNGEDNSIQVSKDNTNITMRINSNRAAKNGHIAELSSVPVLINDKTYVTEEFISALPHTYITKTSDNNYNVMACDIPNTQNMMNIITELSKEPRGVADETHKNAKQYLINLFDSYGYEVTTQDFDLSEYIGNDGKTSMGTNIIVTKKADLNATGDVLILGAHYDAVNGFPGANDNGSGVSVLMEIARIIKDFPTDTEIRFILFDAEEIGLVGSKQYVKNLTDSKNVIGMINFDMLGAAKAENLGVHTGNGKRNYLFDILTSIPYYQDTPLKKRPTNAMSDYVSFTARVIPTLDISHSPIDEEYHNENDLLENIDGSKLSLSADYGLSITKKVMTNTTPSYMNVAKPTKEIGTVEITEKTVLDMADLVDVISRHLGAELVQIESDDFPKYKVYVKLFGMDKKASLIYEGFLGSQSAGNPIIEFTDSDITFEEIKSKLDEVFGAGERKDIDGGHLYKYDNIYGNTYVLYNLESEQRFYLDINPRLDNNEEVYAILNNNIVRMNNDRLADAYTISNVDGKITVETDLCVPDENLEVTERAKECFEKIKPYINDEILADISHIVIQTSGIGGGQPISIYSFKGSNSHSIYVLPEGVEENPVPEEYKDLPQSIISFIKGIQPGEISQAEVGIGDCVLFIDYLELLNENGRAYSKEDLAKNIARLYFDYYVIAGVRKTEYVYPKDGTLFEKGTYRFEEDSFVYKFADMFYQDVFALDNYYDYDLFGENPSDYVCEEAANSLVSDLAYSFAEFVVSDKPVSNNISDKKVMFFYDYPEFVEKRTELRNIAGLSE